MEDQILTLEKQLRKKNRPDRWITLYRCLFFISFFLAILIANTGWRSEASWVGFLSESSLLSFQRTASSVDVSFLNILLRQRALRWCILVLFSRTLPGMWYGGAFVAWQGFSLSFFFVSVLTRYGIRGMSVFFCICFPQWLIYLAVVFGMLRLMVWYRDWQAIHGNEKRGRYILFCILLSGGYAVGIACEYFINPMFLDMAKKLIISI